LTNLENQSTFDKVMAKITVAPFLVNSIDCMRQSAYLCHATLKSAQCHSCTANVLLIYS